MTNDGELSNLRYGECLKGLQPWRRSCAGCEELYNCAHGAEVCFGDMSITDKVIKLGYYITDTAILREMSLDELREYNAAIRTKKQLDRQEETKNRLTAGAYDADTGTWTNGANEHIIAEDSEPNSRLTAGKWDSKKGRWVT